MAKLNINKNRDKFHTTNLLLFGNGIYSLILDDSSKYFDIKNFIVNELNINENKVNDLLTSNNYQFEKTMFKIIENKSEDERYEIYKKFYLWLKKENLKWSDWINKELIKKIQVEEKKNLWGVITQKADEVVSKERIFFRKLFSKYNTFATTNYFYISGNYLVQEIDGGKFILEHFNKPNNIIDNPNTFIYLNGEHSSNKDANFNPKHLVFYDGIGYNEFHKKDEYIKTEEMFLEFCSNIIHKSEEKSLQEKRDEKFFTKQNITCEGAKQIMQRARKFNNIKSSKASIGYGIALDIVGWNPYNDRHIIWAIKNNKNIVEINFYLYKKSINWKNQKDYFKEAMRGSDKKINFLDSKEFLSEVKIKLLLK